MKRRIILILVIVFVIGLIVLGVTYYIRQNTGPRLLARIQLALLKTRDYDRAAELARDYIEDNPDDWQGYYMLGRAHMGNAAYVDARRAFDKAQELNPAYVELVVRRSQTDSVPAERRAAGARDEKDFNDALAGFSKSNDLLKNWARERRQAEEGLAAEDARQIQIEEARNLTNQADCSDRFARHLSEQSGVARAEGDVARADDLAARAQEQRKSGSDNRNTALSRLNQAFSEAPSEDAAGRLLVELSLDMLSRLQIDGDENAVAIAGIESRLADMERTVRMLPAEGRPPVTTMRLRQWALDNLLEVTGIGKADEPLREAAELYASLALRTPEQSDERALLRIAQAGLAIRRGLADEALVYADQALAIDKQRYTALLYRAQALDALGRNQEAEQEFKGLVSRFPKYDTGLVEYARYALKMGKPEEARSYLAQIARRETSPDASPAAISVRKAAYRLLIDNLLSQRRGREALSDAQDYFKFAPTDPYAVRLLARAAAAIGETSAVGPYLDRLASDNPGNPGMLLAVGESWLTLRNSREARSIFERMTAIEPRNVAESMDVVQAHIHLGRLADAEKLLGDLRREYPDYPPICGKQGAIHALKGQNLQAADQFRQALVADPEDSRYRNALAAVLIREGNYGEAERVLKQPEAQDAETAQLLDLIRIRRGEDSDLAAEAETGAARAYYLLQIGQPDKAIEYCRELLDRSEGDRDVEVLRLLARSYVLSRERDRLAGAAQALTEALTIQPMHQDLYNQLAAVLSDQAEQRTPGNQDNLNEVEKTMQAVPGVRPECVSLAMGIISAIRKDFERAAGYYRRIIEQQDLPPESRYLGRQQLALVLASAGKTDEALAELRGIPDNPLLRKRVLMSRAQIQMHAGREKDAKDALKELGKAALDDRDAGTLLEAARMYASLKDTQAALETYDTVIGLEPNDATIYRDKGLFLESLNRLDEAEAAYRLAVQRQPGDFKGCRDLVRLLDARLRTVDALAVLAEFEKRGSAEKAEASYWRAMLFAEWGLHVRAAEELTRLAEQDSGYARTPRVMLALGRSMARLGKEEDARRMFDSIPKYAPEYVPARLGLARLANTDDEKLRLLDELQDARPGLATDVTVVSMKVQTLFDAKRYDEVFPICEAFEKKHGKDRVPAAARFIKFQSMLQKKRFKDASDFALEVVNDPKTVKGEAEAWRRLGVMMLSHMDAARTEQLLPRIVEESDGYQALVGLVAAYRAGKDLAPWFGRLKKIEETGQNVPATTLLLMADIVAKDAGRMNTHVAQIPKGQVITKRAFEELAAYASKAPDKAAEEASRLLEANLAWQMQMPVLAAEISLDVLAKRPESQCAVVIANRNVSDTEVREKRILGVMHTGGALVEKLVEASVAYDRQDFERMVKLYREIAEMEKDNPSLLREQANTEILAGNLEEAARINKRVWELDQDDIAANNAASLTATLWPGDRAKMAEARTLIQAAIEKRPGMAAYLDTLGWINHLLGDDKAALEQLRQAIRGVPNYIEAHAHIGAVEAVAGSRDLAAWHSLEALALAKALQKDEKKLNPEQERGVEIAEKTLSTLGLPPE